MAFSHTVLMGNLVRNPEVKFLGDDGTAVCNFTVACNERYTDRQGEPVERAMFMDCVCWGKRGEFVGEYFVKGQQILVSGKLQLDTWEDDEGNKRSKHKVNVFDVSFVGTKAENEKLKEDRDDEEDGSEDDIPF